MPPPWEQPWKRSLNDEWWLIAFDVRALEIRAALH
jgi:hypothetical protein